MDCCGLGQLTSASASKFKAHALVLMAGRSGSGKTHTFFSLKVPSVSQGGRFSTVPTKFLNWETVRLSEEKQTKVFEFLDPSGEHPELWESLYKHVPFDCVIYCIDATMSDSKDEKSSFVEDRMELQTMLVDDSLEDAKFIIYCNFKMPEQGSKNTGRKKDVQNILDCLGLMNVPLKTRNRNQEQLDIEIRDRRCQRFDIEVVDNMTDLMSALIAPSWNRLRRGQLELL